MGATDDRALAVRPGSLIGGKYEVTGTLGRGGMGVVVSAMHTILRQPVALKFLLPGASSTTIERFLREAQASASLQSAHVARVTDTGTLENGSPYLVMEFLEGTDMAKLLDQRGLLRVEEAVDFMLQALDALAEAHSRGIVHRDLKPSNFFIARRADGSTILKVLDFGLAKAEVMSTADRKLTRKDTILGTPFYISPEQFRSSSSVDARSDLWSLGVILYEALSGKRPFTGASPGEVLTAIFEGIPRSVRERRPDVPAEVEDIIRKLLTREVDQRFQTAGDVAEALLPFGSGKWTEAGRRAMALRGVAVAVPPAAAAATGKRETIRIAPAGEFDDISQRFGGSRAPPPPVKAGPSHAVIGVIAMLATLFIGLVVVAVALYLRGR